MWVVKKTNKKLIDSQKQPITAKAAPLINTAKEAPLINTAKEAPLISVSMFCLLVVSYVDMKD